MEFEHDGILYTTENFTLAQMELLSGLLENAKTLIQKNLKQGDIENNFEIAISINDIINELRKKRELARFIAVCAVQKGKGFNEANLPEQEKTFKTLPYEVAEEVIAFFFSSGLFLKIVTPSFLMLPETEATDQE